MKDTKESKKKAVQDNAHDELKTQLARVLADYDNLKKRVESERVAFMSFASKRVLDRLLPIADNLETVLAHVQDQGLAIAVGDFKNVLKEEGLIEIAPKEGDAFDHDTMEAIDTVATDDENMQARVASCAQKGWKYQDGQILRHAKVVVYSK